MFFFTFIYSLHFPYQFIIFGVTLSIIFISSLYIFSPIYFVLSSCYLTSYVNAFHLISYSLLFPLSSHFLYSFFILFSLFFIFIFITFHIIFSLPFLSYLTIIFCFTFHFFYNDYFLHFFLFYVSFF